MVKFLRYVYSFWHSPRTWQTHTHRQTHTDTAWRHRPRLCIASRGKNRSASATWEISLIVYRSHLKWFKLCVCVTAQVLWNSGDVSVCDRYRDNAKKVSQLMADQPSTPADRIRFWVNYVVRHGGASHLHSRTAWRLNWFQYWCLDVAVCLLTTLAVVIFLVYRLLHLIVSVVGGAVMKAIHTTRSHQSS